MASFLLWLLLNLVLNAAWAIPGIVLLILHFWLGISLWWAIAAFGLWILGTVLFMLLIGKAAGTESPAERRRTNRRKPGGPQGG